MATEFKLPELGENIEAADVVNVLVKEGDVIKKDQAVLEIETDKATIEVPSTIEGKITQLLVKSGDKVKVGATILLVEETGSGDDKSISKSVSKIENKAEDKKEEVKPESKSLQTPKEQNKTIGKKEIVDFRLPELGENIESADVTNVLVKVGDAIEKDQAILEIETDKATIEVPSTLSGKVVEVLIKSGEKAKVGEVMIKVESGAEAVEESKQVEVKRKKYLNYQKLNQKRICSSNRRTPINPADGNR